MLHPDLRGVKREGKVEALAISIPEAAAACGISRAGFYRLLSSGAIPSFWIGARHLVRKADLDAFLERQLAAAGAAQGQPDV
jgi:excisionase family DNA binding protein